MRNSDPLKETARHLEAPAQHRLQVQKSHLASEAHKPMRQVHIAHGHRLNSPKHHDHAVALHAKCLSEHHPA